MEAASNALIDDDISLIMADYSMPYMSGTMSPTHESLTQSQYAQVVFHDIADSYPTDSDVSCRYSLTSGVEVQEGDFVAVFQVGWDSIDEAILKHPALIPDQSPRENGGHRSGQVLFRADALPKDEQEFYQLCYVTADGSVCGASVPFQFRRPHEEELCAVEGMEGEMVVVRSRTAVAEEKLHKIAQQQEEAQREKNRVVAELQIASQKLKIAKEGRDELMDQIEKLRAEKEELELQVEKGKQYERQITKLQSELKSMNDIHSKMDTRVKNVSQHSDMLTATVEMLSADKARMAGLLRANVRRGDDLKNQLSETRRQVVQLQSELEDTKIQMAKQATEIKSQNREKLEDLEMRLEISKTNEKRLLEELASATEGLLTADRYRKDIFLLQEHRDNLEDKLRVSDVLYNDLKKEMASLSNKATALSAQVLDLGLQLAKEKEREKSQERKTSVSEAKAMQSDCEQCETAGEQVSLLESQVRELRLRLEMGAEEYKKIYVEKCKVEKKLAKIKQGKPLMKESTSGASTSSSSSKPSGFTIVGFNDLRDIAGIQSSSSSDLMQNRICPMCNVTFPPGSSDLFTQHFENHLS